MPVATGTSMPWVVLQTTLDTLQEMAQSSMFHAMGKDDVQAKIKRNSVIGRFGRMDPALDGPERGIALPGLTVTYMGMRSGVAHGSFCHDQPMYSLLVQLIDGTTEGPLNNAETYFHWMTLIREHLQANPYARHDSPAGQIYLVHVTEANLPDEEQWAIDRQMRMALTVQCFAQQRRTKDQQPWLST